MMAKAVRVVRYFIIETAPTADSGNERKLFVLSFLQTVPMDRMQTVSRAGDSYYETDSLGILVCCRTIMTVSDQSLIV